MESGTRLPRGLLASAQAGVPRAAAPRPSLAAYVASLPRAGTSSGLADAQGCVPVESPGHTGQQAPPTLVGAGQSAGWQVSTKQVTCPSRHSQMVQGSRVHSAPSACELPSASTQSVPSRDSSFFICFLRSVMVFCISRTNSRKSVVPAPCGCSKEGSVVLLGGTRGFPALGTFPGPVSLAGSSSW